MSHAGRPAPERIAARSAKAASTPDADESLLRSTGSIAFATLLSRITGFVRLALLLAVLGSAATSSFQVANQLPQQISELVLGAVLTAIVVPVLVRAQLEDRDGGASFINRLFTLAVLVLGGALVLALLAAPLLTGLLIGDSKVNATLTLTLTYLLLPQLLFYGLSALFTAVLNVHGAFRPGAWAPVLANLVQIVTLVAFVYFPGDRSLNPATMSNPKLLLLGIGTTLGIVVQAAIQIPALRRVGVSLRFELGIDDRLRKFGGMAAAIVLYVLISLLGFWFATHIAADASAGGPAIYSYAWAILQLPYGIIGVTVLTTIMPRLSRHAANEDTHAVVDDLSQATRLTMLALIPVAVFTTFFGPAIGRALFGYGHFGAADASHLGTALSFQAFVLVPYALVLIHLRVFYAREQAWTPTFIILAITGLKVVFSAVAPMVTDDGARVVELLGAATGVAFIGGAFMGWYLLRRSLGRITMTNARRVLTQTLVVSLLATATVWGVFQMPGIAWLSTHGNPLAALGYLLVAALLALALTYATLAYLRVPDVVAIAAPVGRIVARLPVIGRLASAGTSSTGAGAVVGAPRDGFLTAGIAEDHSAAAPSPRDRLDAQRRQDERNAEITLQMQRVTDDSGLPYAGQARIARRFDRGTVSWQPLPADLRYRRRGAFDVSDDEAANGTENPTGETAAHPTPTSPTATSPTPTSPTPTTPQRAGGAPRRGPKLIPGALVAGGRYRLIANHGATRGLQFWQARDTNLERDVALTFVDSDQKAPTPVRGEQISLRGDGPQSVLSRTLRLGRINSPGVARVLDVVRGSSGGIVVSEWISGSPLAAVAGAEPSAIGAARAVRSLAAAAEATHRSGGALSIDHPDRIRISHDGNAFLAFPGTLADSTKASDVRGLGAVLYALLVQRWALDGDTGHELATGPGEVGQLPLADAKPDGTPVDPRTVRGDIPFEISAVASRALAGNAGIQTAATVQHMLDQASVVDQKTDLLRAIVDDPAPEPGARSAASTPSARVTSSDHRPVTAKTAAAAEAANSTSPKTAGDGTPGRPSSGAASTDRQRNRALLAISLVAVVLVVLAIAGFVASKFFNAGSSSTAQDLEQVLTPSPTSSAGAAAPAAPRTEAIAASAVSIMDFTGQGETQTNLQNVLTGQGAAWTTEAYRTGPAFGGLKPGTGLMFTVPEGSTLTGGSIVSRTPGVTIEVRSSTAETPASLANTTLLWQGTLRDGTTPFTVTNARPAGYVLVWITGLVQSDGGWRASIGKVSFVGSG